MAESLALAELLASKLHTVPKTSHQMMQEDPNAVNKIIDEFVARLRT